MRLFLYAAAALAVVAVSSPDSVRSALAASASALFEATPFAVAGMLLSRIVKRTNFIEYLGCGCGVGPSARSLPAAAATWLLFGPFVAVARFFAAIAVDAIAQRRTAAVRESTTLLHQLAALFPASILAGAAAETAETLGTHGLSPFLAAALGAALGFTAAPCGLGAVAVAGALRVRAPIAAATFLCVAGIVDLRALRHTAHPKVGHDAFAYALLGAALAIVALRRGDALVHPAFAIALGCCAAIAIFWAGAYRQARSAAARIPPILMLAGALVGAPPPQYRATETTLTDLFAGESLSFTGVLARNGGHATLARYAITCCRADAAPVAVALDRVPPYAAGTWLRVNGTIENRTGDYRLRAATVVRVAPPADPFIYR